MVTDREDVMTFDLDEHLEIHHLDVTPREDQSSIEFVLHATLSGVSEEKIEFVEDSRLAMEKLVCSTTGTDPETS